MADAFLENVNLGSECVWQDEFAWSPVAQQVTKATDGTSIIEYLYPHASGRPITFDCGWVSKDTVDLLVSLRDRVTQTTMTLVMQDGRAFFVAFRHQDFPPVLIEPAAECAVGFAPEWQAYRVTIKLMEV